jgi:alpha-D-xyloside xylohydrolase
LNQALRLPRVDVSDPTRIPVYLREGAIIPMEVAGDVTPFGTAASAGALTVLIAPSEGGSSFEVVAEDESIEATVSAQRDASSATVDLGAHARRLILRVRG